MKILLIYPDFLEGTKNAKKVPGNYSEGLASISAVLKEAGYEVALYHQTWMPDKDEFISEVKSYDADVYSFTLRTTAVPFVTEMAGWLDDELPDVHVTCGGYHPTLIPDEVIQIRGIDSICIGEGEYPTCDLMDSLRDTGSIRTDIESLYFKLDDGTIVKNAVRPMIEDLDELPFPDLDLFDYTRLRTGIINTAMLMVSRGCLFSCTYCGNSQFRNVYPNRKHYARFRTPENAIKIVERILEKQPNTKYLEFRDAIFNMYEDWFYEFMPMYIEKIHLPFNCNLRFDLMDERMVKTLAEAGCYMIDIGLENGNEEFRTKYLHRTMKNDHMIRMSQWLREYKITTVTYNIVGLPYETLELSLETVKLNARMDVDKVIANIFYPYPMTMLSKTAEDAGFIDPKVDPNDMVQLRMPNYSRSDILYASYRFLKLMKQYRKLYALPASESSAAIAKLDKKILSPTHPRGLIWRYDAFKDNCIRFAKRMVSRFAPGVYLKLRNRRITALSE
jgi:radical SAM superfamily enzyme YgiQ (UPF0313 family)